MRTGVLPRVAVRVRLVRHPPPAVAAGLCYGQTDLPLADDVAAWAKQLRDETAPVLPCYTSPLQRCRLLAEALHPAPVADSRLMEMNFGLWEMQAWSDLSRSALDAWAADPMGFAPPGGESVMQMQARVLAFLRERDEEDLLLVTHGGVIKLLWGLVHGEPPEVWQARRFAYGGLVKLDLPDALFRP
ncbi:MAG TPA: alpha-ribazole phosphatase family protein [Rhodocyclaceae bacterium]|nr:alpha-ribazole phosphatase family protein [Rhodocyclaceae bacterium]